MTEPRIIGDSLEGVLERVIFENLDPRVQRLKGIWEAAKREADALLAAACDENYRTRLDYHRTCGEPQAEELARADAAALRQLCQEEYDERLSAIWREITERVSRVVEDLRAEAEDR